MIFIYFLFLISSLIFCESDKIESKKMETKLENITLDMNLEHLFGTTGSHKQCEGIMMTW